MKIAEELRRLTMIHRALRERMWNVYHQYYEPGGVREGGGKRRPQA